MTCRVQRYGANAPPGYTPGMVKSMTFHCDFAGCARRPPQDIESLAGGGMRGLGWYASGGVHYCPDHNPEPELPLVPERMVIGDTQMVPPNG